MITSINVKPLKEKLFWFEYFCTEAAAGFIRLREPFVGHYIIYITCTCIALPEPPSVRWVSV